MTQRDQKSRIVRKKGAERRKLIIAATRNLLASENLDQITLAQIASAAEVPISSLYHFYANVDEIYVEIVEQFRRELLLYMAERIADCDSDKWQELVEWLIDMTRDFYIAHPEFMQLILSGRAKASIKMLDRDSDSAIAQAVIAGFEQYFVMPELPNLHDVSYLSLEIVDLIFGLSVQKHSEITPHFLAEAKRASLSYLRTYLPEVLVLKTPS